MGGAIYFRDEKGNTVQAGSSHPLPVQSGAAAAAADESEE